MFFKRQNECSHSRVTPDKESQYCPDCGKFIENHWYLTRCNCCNIKRHTIIKFGEILPETKFCPNCGAEHFRIEKVKSINFIDINFAILIKEVNEELSRIKCQSWIERENNQPVKLLGILNFNFS